MTGKVKSYFNIYEYGINILDRIDVTYQRAFMITPKDKYYNALLDTPVKDNKPRGETLFNEKIHKSVGKVIKETESEFERNYNEYQSPIVKKYVLTIDDSVYYELNEHIDTISDNIKKVDARNNPIKETHIVNIVRNLSVRVDLLSQPSSESESVYRASPNILLTGTLTLICRSKVWPRFLR